MKLRPYAVHSGTVEHCALATIARSGRHLHLVSTVDSSPPAVEDRVRLASPVTDKEVLSIDTSSSKSEIRDGLK